MLERVSLEKELEYLESEIPSDDIYEEFKKLEIDHAKAKDCHKLHPTLMQRLVKFDQLLKQRQVSVVKQKGPAWLTFTGPLFLYVVSCYRAPSFSQKLHYARMITWGISGIQNHVNSATSRKKAKGIYLNALKEFKIQNGLTSNQMAKDESKRLKDTEFKSMPVLPGVDNCPCRCFWSRSKHTLDTAEAIDANIKGDLHRLRWTWQPALVYTGNFDSSFNPKPDSPLTQQMINNFNQDTKTSKLIWGLNFKNIPPDPVHWELPDKIYPSNPGSLDAWDLRNKSLGGKGPLVKKIGVKDPRVEHLQKMLLVLEYDLGEFGLNNDGIDGYFEDITLKAVEDFQSSHSDFKGNPLVKDGKAGPLTVDAVNVALNRIWYSNYYTPDPLWHGYSNLP